MNEQGSNMERVQASPLERLERLYFVGVGGIGMSALARYFKSRGCTVSGYDKTVTPTIRSRRN